MILLVYHNLYDVVEGNKRGPKASTMNRFMAANIPPPSLNGSQKTANMVSKMVEDINR